MNTHNRTFKNMSLVCAAALLASLATISLHAAEPETVMVTLHAKPGAEDELSRVLARHCDTVRRLDFVLDTPHVRLRGAEGDNKTYFVEIFTWRDGDIPDHAPGEVQAIWAELNRLVERRNGQPGLHFVAVSTVGSEPSPTR